MKRLLFVFAALVRSSAAPATDSAPVLQWVKTAGGSGINSAAAAAVDGSGNLYIVGSTSSPNFPVIGAANSGSGDTIATTDVFAMKLDNNGNIVYSTRFGGSNSDQAVALAVGADGSLYLAGSTNSTDFPVTTGAYMTNAPASTSAKPQFICKLNPAGSIEWATYFPASNITSIAVDLNGNPFVAGSSQGGLPTTPGAYATNFIQYVGSNGFFGVVGPTSAFVTKLNAQGSGLIYSTMCRPITRATPSSRRPH